MGLDGGGFGDRRETADGTAVGVDEEFGEVTFDPAAE
jgi:hypothetical protein